MSEAGPTSDGAVDGRLRRRARATAARQPGRPPRLAATPSATVATRRWPLVVVDSDAELHGADPSPSLPDPDRVGGIPGLRPDDDIDGSVEGTAGGPAVLLTRRAARLNAHAGQWAIPGGRIDHGESPLQGALRELDEELGLRLGARRPAGPPRRLPDPLGLRDQPVRVLGWCRSGARARPRPRSTRSTASPSGSCAGPIRPASSRSPRATAPSSSSRSARDLIHAPTGAVLYQFRRVALEGVCERVDELEQPLFAWR